jgi:PilZ domain
MSERRAWVRMPKDQRVSCQRPIVDPPADESETAWMGTVRDVSAGGIAVVLNRRFEPGTILIVTVSAKGAESRHVSVCHATPENGHWLIGCAFAQALDQDELRRFLGE